MENEYGNYIFFDHHVNNPRCSDCTDDSCRLMTVASSLGLTYGDEVDTYQLATQIRKENPRFVGVSESGRGPESRIEILCLLPTGGRGSTLYLRFSSDRDFVEKELLRKSSKFTLKILR